MRDKIKAKFKELKKQGKKAFIAFITAGDPNLKITEQLILRLPAFGVDILELGVPFSDPLADGLTIQAASKRALLQKVSVGKILDLLKKMKSRIRVPIVLFSYFNPIYKLGIKKFAKMASDAGIDGLIIPDLPLEESKEIKKAVDKEEIDLIFLIAPTTTAKRAKAICQQSQGFIYYVSRTGITGTRKGLPADVRENIKRIRKNTTKPVVVGFGISNSGQVKQVADMNADGVVVGSAIVKLIEKNLEKKNLLVEIENFIKKLKYGDK